MRKFAAALLATAALTAPASAAERIVNGGFEADVIAANTFDNRTVASQGITGWTVASGDVDIVRNNLGTAATGQQWLDLVGFNSGAISQTFDTAVGAIYTLTFQYGHNDLGGAASRTASYSIGGLNGQVTHTGPGFTYFGSGPLTFTGTGGLMTLTFADVGGSGNAGIALDTVSVLGAVPEPATWAMMIMGFGLVGAALRRRPRVSANLRLA